MRTALALCGGGCRGVTTAALLCRFDVQDLIGTPDLLAGTSTGGLIALMIATGKDSSEIRSSYKRYAPRIFHRPWWRRGLFSSKYPPHGIEAVAREIFEHRRMMSCQTPTMVVSYSLRRRPKVFKSWQDGDELMRDVARATSAAPTYFPPTEEGFVDGGVWANNPSMCAYVEMRRLWPDETKFKVVCIGTGDTGGEIRASQAARWGMVGWSTSVANLFMDSGAAGVGYQCRTLLGANYIEINPELGSIPSDMDRCDPEHLDRLQQLGEDWVI